MIEEEKKKINVKNQLIKISILVIAIVVLGVSLSYAYYSANKTGNGIIDERTAAKLDLTTTLTNAPNISNMKLTLIEKENIKTDAEKVAFTVTNANTSTVNGKYFIYLTNIKLSKNLYSSYFKWQLVRVTSSGENIVASGNFANASEKRSDTPVAGESNNVITTLEDISLNSNVLTIAPNTTDSLVFRIWLENDPNVVQNELTSGSFEGKLKLEATPSH